jgi:coproporphyrinogen III oxidase
MKSAWLFVLALLAYVEAWCSSSHQQRSSSRFATRTRAQVSNNDDETFDDFVEFLQTKQTEIIRQIEQLESSFSSEATFGDDPWSNGNSTGRTRVLQGGTVVDKGACSLTVIRNGILTAERAKNIKSRSLQQGVNAGDEYFAAALSMVLHSSHPMVPTFRSDVRIFLVKPTKGETVAWLGGGADLTPSYLFDEDVSFFHSTYKELCQEHGQDHAALKAACDDYFYLPARSEHRGTGGIFMDDIAVTPSSIAFTKGVVEAWMPSWFPIVKKRQVMTFTEQEKQWQLLRRGRYLEFNLLYDRGVKFGLANANPRTEGVMVSAPPMIAYEYNHKVEPGSREDKILQVLRQPKDWV